MSCTRAKESRLGVRVGGAHDNFAFGAAFVDVDRVRSYAEVIPDPVLSAFLIGFREQAAPAPPVTVTVGEVVS